MYPNTGNKLCYQDRENLERDQYEDRKVRLSSGSEVDVTYYSDGTSIVHYGGPCSSVCYDANGEEC